MADSIDDGEQTPFHMIVIKYWLPVATMFGIMYSLSTDVFSGDNTRSVIEKIFLGLLPHASNHTLATLNYVVRKSAHFIEYAILAGLLFRAFRADNPLRWRFRWAVCALASTALWAVLDELHQTFTRTRGGSIWDSLLDSTGGLFALSLIALYSAWRPARSPETGSSFHPDDPDLFK